MAKRVGRLEIDRARARQVVLLLAGVLGMSEDTILNAQSRPATIARHMAFVITRNAFGMSLARVALAFGRDRSSVASACAALEDKRDDLAFDRWITALENSAAVAPAPSLNMMADAGGFLRETHHPLGGGRE